MIEINFITILEMILGFVVFLVLMFGQQKLFKKYGSYGTYFLSNLMWVLAFFFLISPILNDLSASGAFVGSMIFACLIIDNRFRKKDKKANGLFMVLSMSGGIIAAIFAYFLGSFLYKSYILPVQKVWLITNPNWKIFLIIATAIASLIFWLSQKKNFENISYFGIYLILLPTALYLTVGAQILGTALATFSSVQIISILKKFMWVFISMGSFVLATFIAWCCKYVDTLNVRIGMEVAQSVLYIISAIIIPYFTNFGV